MKKWRVALTFTDIWGRAQAVNLEMEIHDILSRHLVHIEGLRVNASLVPEKKTPDEGGA